MTWVKLDDGFADHPKMEAAGPLAGWLNVAALCYAAKHLTDGLIPAAKAPRLVSIPAPSKHVRTLIAVDAWHEPGHDCPDCPPCPPGHYLIHDYLVYQRSRAEMEAERERERIKKQRQRSNGMSTRNGDGTFAGTPQGSPPERPQGTPSGTPPETPGGSPSVPTPTPIDDLTSSDGLTTRPDTPDDDHHPDRPPIVCQAVAILAHQDLNARQTAPGQPPIGDPVAWENAAYKRRLAVAGPLVDLAGQHPDWTAEQLANFAEPPPTLASTNGDNRDPRTTAYDAQQQAGRAAQEAHMSTVHELAAQPPDAGRNVAAIHDIRARHPLPTAPPETDQ